jgi:hypothetical protein
MSYFNNVEACLFVRPWTSCKGLLEGFISTLKEGHNETTRPTEHDHRR